MNQKLSICIVTYNRANLLEETLRSFISQVREYDIPIFISDNCSQDNTQDIILKCKSEYQNIFYSTNSENIGFDGNLINAVNLSNTEYCWLFGDDDLIEEGAIRNLIEIIENNYDLIVVNASTYDLNLTKQISAYHCQLLNDRSYEVGEANQAFHDLAVFSSFVGCLVVRRELWNKVDFKKYLKTGFVHVGIAFEYLVNKRAFFISKPQIKIRLGNSGWSQDSFRIWYVLWVKAISELPYYDNSLKDRVAIPIKNISITTMFLERARGRYNTHIFRDILKDHKNVNTFRRLVFFVIALIPIFIPKKIFSVYLILKKPAFFEYQLSELNSNARATNYI